MCKTYVLYALHDVVYTHSDNTDELIDINDEKLYSNDNYNYNDNGDDDATTSESNNNDDQNDDHENETAVFVFQLCPDIQLNITSNDIEYVRSLVINTRLATRAPSELLDTTKLICNDDDCDTMTKSVSDYMYTHLNNTRLQLIMFS